MDASASAPGPADGGPGVHRARARAAVATRGGVNGVRPAPPAVRQRRLGASLLAFLIVLAGTGSREAAASPGTRIRNTATIDYLAGGESRRALSNEVSLVVAPPPTRASARILRPQPGGPAVTSTAGPTACLGAAGFAPLPPPILVDGQPADPLNPIALGETALVHGGEAVFLEVADGDQNRDPDAVDTIELEVTSSADDVERLRLVENGVDTGVFTGYIQSTVTAVVRGDCVLQAAREGEVAAGYVDPADGSDSAHARALVDPVGRVFDSRSGQPVNGARVRLVEAATGGPARVVGDDGVSAYPAEVVTGGAVTDAGGTIYTFPPGVFRFPLVAAGSYRLVVTPPDGYEAPSTATPEDLAALPGAPFRLGPGSWGQEFPITGPVPAAIDVPVDPSGTALFVTKTTPAAIVAVGDFVQYKVTVENTGDAGTFPAVQALDRLPAGLRYRPGSTRIDGSAAADPVIDPQGSELRFPTGALAAGERVTLSYVAEVTVAARGRELVNTAWAVAGNGTRSNEARATLRLREDLHRSAATIVGRVVASGCAEPGPEAGVAGVRIYLEDGRHVVTDDDGRYHLEGVAPGTHVVQLDPVTLPEGLEPVRCGTAVRHAGRAYSQFVDLRAGSLWRADFALAPGSPRRGEALSAPAPTAAAEETGSDSTAAVERAGVDVERLSPGVALLQPAAGEQPAIPSLKIAVQHAPPDSVTLSLNGRAVGSLHYDGTVTNRADTVALSRWRGVDLRDGDNALVVVVQHADGRRPTRIERTVHYAGGAVRAELDAAQSMLRADGRARPVIALRMFDAHGKPARTGTLGAWQVDPPYRSWWEVETLNDNPMMVTGQREPTFEVGEDGVARLELEPTSQSGTVTIRLRFNDRQQQELRAWLEPDAREWILVGLAEGSLVHREISRNMEAAGDAGLKEGLDGGERVAFFAKGRIKGEFLLTLAYDSARDREEARESLFGLIEPDRYYTLYGDATESRHEAASVSKLFLKLERRQFYALFGDFDTGLTVTELTRYARSMNGLKAEYGGARLALTAFAAESELGYGRDELQGDGTSGLYRLSRRDLVTNSDRVRIEVRDRFRSEIVLESRDLVRFIDYDVDYGRGTLFFKQPVPSRDGAFNPVWIVAEYEVLAGGERPTTAGGRVAAPLAGGRAEIGASYVHQGAADGATAMGGADLRVALGAATELRAEIARSDSDEPARQPSATAYLGELRHISETLDLRAYLREQEAGFGVGQTFATEDGTRKAGVDGRLRLGRHWDGVAEAFTVENLDTGAERRHLGAELRRVDDRHALGFGLRRVEDLATTAGDLRSDQAFARGSLDLPDGRTTLRAGSELALGGRDESADYPSRAVVGIDYRLTPSATLFTEYERARGESLEADMSRVGLRATPWSRAQVNSSVSQRFTENGERVSANLGLIQGWQVNDRFALDAGVDQTRTLAAPDLAPIDTDVPLASGSLDDDFVATFLGALYRTDTWTATGRLERRRADREERWAASGGLYREERRGHAFSASLRWLDSGRDDGSDAEETGLSLGWAFRPEADRWIVLNRLDWIGERSTDAGASVESERIVNNLNLNGQLDPRTQLGLQFGLRYAVSTFDGARYSGLSDLYGVDLRRELDERFDVGLHGTLMQSRRSGVSDCTLGLDLGVTFARNVWISIGYNFTGFDDEDYSASRYTSQGPYLKIRMKADQDTFRDLLAPARLSPGTAP